MSQAKANGQNIYAIVTVMDVRIRNLEPGPGNLREKNFNSCFKNHDSSFLS